MESKNNKIPSMFLDGSISQLLSPLSSGISSSMQSLNEYGIPEANAQNALLEAAAGGIDPKGAFTDLLGEKGGGIAGAGLSLLNLVPGGSLIGAGLGAGAGAISNFVNSDKQTAEVKKKEFEVNRMRAQNGTLANISGAQYTKPTFAEGGAIDQVQGNRHENGGTNIGGVIEAEKGETINNRFVFSDRTKVDKRMVKDNENLEKYLGKTIAEASVMIDKEFKLRPNDPFDAKVRDSKLNDLRLAQEVNKLRKQSSSIGRELGTLIQDGRDSLEKFEGGGGYDPEDERANTPLVIDGTDTGYTLGQFYNYLEGEESGDFNISNTLSKYGADFTLGDETLKGVKDSGFIEYASSASPEASNLASDTRLDRGGAPNLFETPDVLDKGLDSIEDSKSSYLSELEFGVDSEFRELEFKGVGNPIIPPRTFNDSTSPEINRITREYIPGKRSDPLLVNQDRDRELLTGLFSGGKSPAGVTREQQNMIDKAEFEAQGYTGGVSKGAQGVRLEQGSNELPNLSSLLTPRGQSSTPSGSFNSALLDIQSKASDFWGEDYNKASIYGNLGNAWDVGRGIHGLLKPEKEFDRLRAQQINPSFLDPTRAIQDVRNSYSSAGDTVSRTATGMGSYLSNRLGLASSEAKSVSGISSNYANQNAQIGNQAKQFNAQMRNQANLTNLDQQRYEELVNQQERDVASNMVQAGLSNFGEIQNSLLKDRRTDGMQQMWLENQSSGKFGWKWVNGKPVQTITG